MGRLHLKETLDKREERTRRRARKAERRARRGRDGPPEGGDDGWTPRASSSKIDPDEVRADVEERWFRAKLFDAMQDDYDSRLDHIEANLNDYAHVPSRWRAADAARDPDNAGATDPNLMGEEEYAEWVRENMWRRTHKAEMEERNRKKAERKAAKKRERDAREETKRLEKEREAERIAKRELKARQRRLEAWEYYETRWKKYMLSELPDKLLKFHDISWPVFSVPVTAEDLSQESISAFLLYGIENDGPKVRKERIREALLRWHPDKFEGKMGAKLDLMQKDMVMEGVGIVARCLNTLMSSTTT
ncbi:hypothetical protein BU17DRAFT_41400 [Hysterangium stoloniferum]|nr:hypothetical protein BU17DRAFT_41400 [Hysterangium stoloniferum]